jgi:16S rRNA (cytosine967-C5)-methyltransferase
LRGWRGVIDYDEPLLRELERVFGAEVEAFLESLLKPPARYYVRVNTLKADPGEVLDELRSLGWRAYTDEELEEAIWMPVEGPERLDDAGCHVIVDKYAAESVMLGAHVYAPGVVRVDESCAREGAEVSVYSENGVHVANGLLVRGFREALERGHGLVVEVVRPLYRLPSLRSTRLYREGLIYEQSLPSMMVARILSPEPGAVIVDMCAAPGGKTGHVYELVRGKARVVAVDHSSRKVAKLRMELRRLGHVGVEVLKADSRYLDLELGKGAADFVVLDPPCSSIGVVPKVYDRKRYSDVVSAASYQRQFLRAAYELLKPGGVLVYSTCTVTLLENEENVAYAVEKLGFRQEDAVPLRGGRGVPPYGLLSQRFSPHMHSMPGYFIARLRKPS